MGEVGEQLDGNYYMPIYIKIRTRFTEQREARLRQLLDDMLQHKTGSAAFWYIHRQACKTRCKYDTIKSHSRENTKQKEDDYKLHRYIQTRLRTGQKSK